MIIHSYLTDGHFEWGKLFLRSFKYHNKEKTPIIFSTRGLNLKQINKLKRIYNNLIIDNESIDYQYISEQMNLPQKEILKRKKEVEHQKKSITKYNVFWKQFISVEDRYGKSILKVMNNLPKGEMLLHLDIDVVFLKKVEDLKNLMKINDITLKFRHQYWDKHKKEYIPNLSKATSNNRVIVGYIIGLNINEASFYFMDRFVSHINSKTLSEKPNGFGQTCLFKAYEDVRNICKVGNFPIWTTANKNNFKKRKEKAFILSGNTGKKKNLLISFKDIYK